MNAQLLKYLHKNKREFPSSLVFKTAPNAGVQVPSQVEELRSHMLWGSQEKYQ